jgi:hypothetical protein
LSSFPIFCGLSGQHSFPAAAKLFSPHRTRQTTDPRPLTRTSVVRLEYREQWDISTTTLPKPAIPPGHSTPSVCCRRTEWCNQPSLLERDENRRNALLLKHSFSLLPFSCTIQLCRFGTGTPLPLCDQDKSESKHNPEIYHVKIHKG